jgi:hypothetical protein
MAAEQRGRPHHRARLARGEPARYAAAHRVGARHHPVASVRILRAVHSLAGGGGAQADHAVCVGVFGGGGGGVCGLAAAAPARGVVPGRRRESELPASRAGDGTAASPRRRRRRRGWCSTQHCVGGSRPTTRLAGACRRCTWHDCRQRSSRRNNPRPRIGGDPECDNGGPGGGGGEEGGHAVAAQAPGDFGRRGRSVARNPPPLASSGYPAYADGDEHLCARSGGAPLQPSPLPSHTHDMRRSGTRRSHAVGCARIH